MGIELVGLRECISDIEQFDREKTMRLQQIVRETGHDVERDAKQYAPLDTGTGIRGTIRTEFDPDGLGARVGPRASWAAYIMEVGRKPGSKMPPVDALIPWVRRHGWGFNIRKSRSTVTYQGVSLAQASYDAQVRGMAFVLARSIAKKGIRPRRYMQLAADANNARFIQRCREALG
jgi:hypothetical protein